MSRTTPLAKSIDLAGCDVDDDDLSGRVLTGLLDGSEPDGGGIAFSEYEARITDQLDRMLGPGGFQSARDIAAITVNRWPHGYAYSADSLFDREVQGPPPYEIARKRRGSVAIANSDAAWNSYTHEAIDHAWRAVNELKSA